MYIRSVFFCFSEAALKRQPRATEAEIKYVGTFLNLAVRGNNLEMHV